MRPLLAALSVPSHLKRLRSDDPDSLVCPANASDYRLSTHQLDIQHVHIQHIPPVPIPRERTPDGPGGMCLGCACNNINAPRVESQPLPSRAPSPFFYPTSFHDYPIGIVLPSHSCRRRPYVASALTYENIRSCVASQLSSKRKPEYDSYIRNQRKLNHIPYSSSPQQVDWGSVAWPSALRRIRCQPRHRPLYLVMSLA